MASKMASTDRVHILHLSDTHGLHRTIEETFPLPPADILIVTGDFTNEGTDAEFADFNAWLGELRPRFRHILVITGNHDWHQGLRQLCTGELSADEVLSPDFMGRRLPNAMVLEHEGVEVLGLHIFGSAWCPWHEARHPGPPPRSGTPRDAAWQAWQHRVLRRGQEAKKGHACRATVPSHRFSEIPAGVDILLTHGPACGIFDCLGGGHQWGSSRELRETIKAARPKVHLFGHLHEQRGIWQKTARGRYKGGVEYEAVPGSGRFFETLGPPAPDYPCVLVSCNAMHNHPGIERGAPERIAGPARLIIAERDVFAGASAEAVAETGEWRFSLPHVAPKTKASKCRLSEDHAACPVT